MTTENMYCDTCHDLTPPRAGCDRENCPLRRSGEALNSIFSERRESLEKLFEKVK